MTAPTTPIRDDFNRTDSTNMGSDWAEGDILGIPNTTGQIVGNQYTSTTANTGVIRYTPSTYGPDCEAYCDVPVIPPSGQWIGIFLRGSTGASGDGYVLEVYNDGGSPDVYLFRVDNTAFTQLGAAVTNGVANGDALMIRAVGSTITAHRRQSGVWSIIMTRTDLTYNVAGSIGAYVNGNTARLDDFGGGTYVPPAAGTSFPFRRRMTKKAMVAR